MINARRICLSVPLFPLVTIFRLCENLCSPLCKSPPLVIPTIVRSMPNLPSFKVRVSVCVCPCARPDLPEQRAAAGLVAAGRRRRREQQRHAGHRGRPGVVGAAVPGHQLAVVRVRIRVGQHER